MKILFISRSNLYKDKGGDTVQIVNTAKYLRLLGVHVDIKLSTENIDYASYDLLHFFNIIRPADILSHIKKANKPFVVSTIYVDYGDYERNERGGLTGLPSKIFSADTLEYFKAIARFILKGEKIASREYLLLGQKRSIKKIMKLSSMLLPNSHSEYKRLSSKYKLNCRYMAIPNAIDTDIFSKETDINQKDPYLVICVGRIEGRKNQLKLIKALNDSAYKLIIIGSPSTNHVKYYNLCKETAHSNVSFIESISQEELMKYYQKAKVHVLPSWIETTGLSSLEAAAMKCNIVVTDKGDTEEYFEHYAFYCDPGSEKSIYETVKKAVDSDFQEDLYKKVFREYIWQVTAEKTLSAYKNILVG